MRYQIRMNPLSGGNLEALIKDLRAQIKKGEVVSLTHAQSKILLEELLRQQQSSDRLRRQNRRVRKRLQAATGEVVADIKDDVGGDASEPADTGDDD